jgi:hypothetical protein
MVSNTYAASEAAKVARREFRSANPEWWTAAPEEVEAYSQLADQVGAGGNELIATVTGPLTRDWHR